MEISTEIKNKYHSDSIHKNLRIEFVDIDLTITNENIQQESMSLKESILEESNIEFVGCIASMFSITLQEITQDIKGQRIKVYISTDETEEIPLFNGIIDSAVMQSNKRNKKVVAYDQLYTKGNIDVSGWYNSLKFPITLKTLRDSLFVYLGIVQEERDLPNDNVSIDKKYEPKSLKSWNVIKAICQINGAFGIINRQDKFEYRILTDLTDTYVYPAVTLFPSTNLFPVNPLGDEIGELEPESFAFYKAAEYEEFEVKPVDKLTIRQSADEAGVSYGTGENNYIIQGNMFTLGKGSAELLEIAERIYRNVNGIYYHPFRSDNSGLPYIECGLDAVSYQMIDFIPMTKSARNISSTTRNFYVFSRELTGIQALRDNYSANGEEYQTEFVTDLQTQIDTIKVNVKEEVKEEVKNEIDNYDFDSVISDYDYTGIIDDYMTEHPVETLKVESVAELPAIPDEDTIYLIQGEVTVT